jgi:hypothetical protein
MFLRTEIERGQRLGDPSVASIASLPKIFADAVKSGALTVEAVLRILAGERNVNTLTNLVFYARHPELPTGYKIQPHEKHLVQQWLDLSERIVRLLKALGPATAPNRTTSGGASAPPKAPPSPSRSTSSSVHDDRAYKPHKKLGGYSRYGGGRLETRLRELRDQSKLSVSDGDIELLQRISNVETGGCLQALNSWDNVYMSIGFMQWPLVFGKLQRLIARAPEAFRRYGIELDSGRTYTIKLRGDTDPYLPIALKGVTHPNELRSLEWGKRFFAAGLDPEIVAREAELALEIIAEERRKIEKRLDRAIPHYDESSPLRALIQETNNHRPAWLRTSLKRAVKRYVSSGASTPAEFLELVRAAIRACYPVEARAAAIRNKFDEKTTAEAVAKAEQQAENLIKRTGTLDSELCT